MVKSKSMGLFVAGGFLLVLAFQNCSGINFQESTFESVSLKETSGLPDDILMDDSSDMFLPPLSDDVDVEGDNNSVPAVPVTGIYEGYTTQPKHHQFIRTIGISYEEALENCEENDRLNPSGKIYCTYDGEEIYRAKEQASTPPPSSSPPSSPPPPSSSSGGTGTYIGYFMDPNPRMFIKTVGITRDEALKNCKVNAASNPSRHVQCTFNGKVIYEAKPKASSVYIGYFTHPTQQMFIKTVGISKAEALSNCKVNAANNPSRKVKCTYDGQVIYQVK